MNPTPAPEPVSGDASVFVLRTLQTRPEFLAANRGKRAARPGFILQALDRRDSTQTIGVGFTCSKKVGNAVARNRAKRRLREIARLELPEFGKPGWNYVLIGRAQVTAARDFETLRQDLRAALTQIHR